MDVQAFSPPGPMTGVSGSPAQGTPGAASPPGSPSPSPDLGLAPSPKVSSSEPPPPSSDPLDPSSPSPSPNPNPEGEAGSTQDVPGADGEGESEPADPLPPPTAPSPSSPTSPGLSGDAGSEDSQVTEGESFRGRIVYRPDGSALILEDPEDAGSLQGLDLELADAIVDHGNGVDLPEGSPSPSSSLSPSPPDPVFPQIASAHFLARQPLPQPRQSQSQVTWSQRHHEAPVMHSFRVYDLRGSSSDVTSSQTSEGSSSGGSSHQQQQQQEDGSSSPTPASASSPDSPRPTKPILMCFICKLSFAQARSFRAHASGEHGLTLTPQEQALLRGPRASAILQGVGRHKSPLLSFLEPVPPPQALASSLGLAQPPTPGGTPSSSSDSRCVDDRPAVSQYRQNGARESGEWTGLQQESAPGEGEDSQGSRSGLPEGQSSLQSDAQCRSAEQSPATESMDQETSSSSPRSGLANELCLPSPASAFLGACEDHPQGRAAGVECPKCDVVLGSAQSLGGHMTMMHSRNSCKTLKCPKCNWHYKYQETLEIHMKEKHPEGDSHCPYCMTGQSHPRLARGESYSCGYKPYRCTVCNYSTTTKGNLSIHMQSDKHINNMQEMANGSATIHNAEVKSAPPPPVAEDPAQFKKQKPKPAFRCEVCNYETTVARNLRIHMTSEKHTHNMMVLSQNMKHMQRDMQMQQMLLLGNQDPALFGLGAPLPPTVYYTADSMLLAGMTAPKFEVPVDLSLENGGGEAGACPGEVSEDNSDCTKLFSCNVCGVFAADLLEALHGHVSQDRSRAEGTDSTTVANGTYHCKLCSYKTQLKANFQLHCKTDKHLQRLQLVNHIREGGVNNDWRMQFLSASNPLQVRCNACDFNTNSIHKLQLHAAGRQHETAVQLFLHLVQEQALAEAEAASSGHASTSGGPGSNAGGPRPGRWSYACLLCGIEFPSKAGLILHAHTGQHRQYEGKEAMVLKEQGKVLELSNIYVVRPRPESRVFHCDDGSGESAGGEEACLNPEVPILSSSSSSSSTPSTATATSSSASAPVVYQRISNSIDGERHYACPSCSFAHVSDAAVASHMQSVHPPEQTPSPLCPLCQKDFSLLQQLQTHLEEDHKVVKTTIERLLAMVEVAPRPLPSPLLRAGPVPSEASSHPQAAPHSDTPSAALAPSSPPAARSRTPTPNIPTSTPTQAPTPQQTLHEGEGEDLRLLGINMEAIHQAHSRLLEEESLDTAASDRGDGEDMFRCQTCQQSFPSIEELYAHQNELGHLELKQTPRGPGYLCWKKGCNQYFNSATAVQVHFREIHAKRQRTPADASQYSHRCQQCSLAFTGTRQLSLHALHHLLQDCTHCALCGQAFTAPPQLKAHLDTGHTERGPMELDRAKAGFRSRLQALLRSPALPSFLSQPATNGPGPRPQSPMAVDEKTLAAKCDNNNTTSKSLMDGDQEPSGEKTAVDAGQAAPEHSAEEDALNTPDVARREYERSSRKFCCHQCGMAFTRTSYLADHNRLHQRERPVDRYMDPSRPHKCDVCKESFTQKSILVVHLNSVSHLHKAKQAGQQVPTPEPERKPYRCNVCNVSFSSGPALDAHISSVGHQARAKAREGSSHVWMQNDVQQMQMLVDFLHQTQSPVAITTSAGVAASLQPPLSLSSPALSTLSGFALPQHVFASTSGTSEAQAKSSRGELKREPESELQFPTSLQPPSSSGESRIASSVKSEPRTEESSTAMESSAVWSFINSTEAMPLSAPDLGPATAVVCPRCGMALSSLDAYQQHQTLCSVLQASSTHSLQVMARPSRSYSQRVKPQVHKNLLESIGFECVMQFNEFNQPTLTPQDKAEKEEEQGEGESQREREDGEDEDEDGGREPGKDAVDLPEINKCQCPTCDKEFSSVWVLKAHQEEVHRHLVPIQAVENFGNRYRSDYEKTLPREPEPLQLPTPMPAQSSASSQGQSGSGEKTSSAAEMPPPPPPPPSLGGHFDMSQPMMPMFGMLPGMGVPMMLGMPPQLMSMMPLDMGYISPLSLDASFLAQQQQQQQQSGQGPSSASSSANTKRVRTRISDEQLKVLRAHFDINNSPSEEQIKQMSEQTCLLPKVIKHWFRNTLFKERQRNKDSPYNFNNPPSTTIDLEEYEKTGRITTSPTVKVEPEDSESQSADDAKLGDLDQEQHGVISFKSGADAAGRFEGGDFLDRKDAEVRSNASSPSSCSSKPVTPATSVPTTPTPGMEDGLLAEPRDTPPVAKRANRTRFTDYQVKVLQEYFEQNAYPKDDELEHLSNLLGLNARVIVVWFQNARQKARKIYENQPATEVKDGNTPFQRTPGQNFQCKKCGGVFQRYYELIKHQKRPCMQEGGNNPGAMDEDSNSTSMSQDSFLSESGLRPKDQAPRPSVDLTPTTPNPSQETGKAQESGATFKCNHCSMAFNRLDLWQEHQKMHTLNPALFSPGFSSGSAFGMLQSLAQQEEGKAAAKRKAESREETSGEDAPPRDKRLRTTILPEQLDYLYQKYQLDCNPSRKQLETIASEVNLKKRVVQVWFQNTRARERKGQYRAHQQLINKRCPYCRALFRAKSALESHLATKHPEEMAKGEINIETIPDASLDASSSSTPQQTPSHPHLHSHQSSSSPYAPPGVASDLSKLVSPSSYLGFLPPALGFSPGSDSLQLSMQQLYEESYKKYISELSSSAALTSLTSHLPSLAPSTASSSTSHTTSHTASSSRPCETESKPPPSAMEDDEAPLDLSKPVKVSTELERGSDGPSTDLSERSLDAERGMMRRQSVEDSQLSADFDDSNSAPSTSSSPATLNTPPTSANPAFPPTKRYRTQMTNQQVQVMKSLFRDYKTPTMAECELLGREIGLPKRVVQVWFQNARAKEKKSKMAAAKTMGSEPEAAKPPEECSLCGFTYSHKFTIQDHIFTKKHIDQVKTFIHSKTEAERDASDSAGVSSILQHQKELERMRKAVDETATSPHLSSLQALSRSSAASLASPMSGSSMGRSSHGSGSKASSSQAALRSEGKKDSRKEAARSEREAALSASAAYSEMLNAAQMMMGTSLSLDPGLLSYMYSNMPAYLPGLSLPLLPPGLLPMQDMMSYDPLTFGTPLQYLQIPPQAIADVQAVLGGSEALATYTQDGLTLAGLQARLGAGDARLTSESNVDVGWVCRKCQMVFPAMEACAAHQRLHGHSGKASERLMLKLEQVQFRCRACGVAVSTGSEFQDHCRTETHQARAARYQQRRSATATPATPAPSATPDPRDRPPSPREESDPRVAPPPADDKVLSGPGSSS